MLTLQFIPHHEIAHLNSNQRIKKLLSIVKSESIVLMQGRLRPEEEVKLIEETMRQISKTFKGIEICTIYPATKNIKFFRKVRTELVRFLLGHREGITIIGPGTIIKEIKRDPNKIQLYAISPRKRKKR